MRYPLLWKELRESKWALLVGVLWVIGPIQFWLTWAKLDAPWPVDLIVVPSAMFASGVAMLILGVARFAYERHTGTWEFLLSRSVSLRRAVAMKFAVGLGLTVFFMSLSAAFSWYPITRTEAHLADMDLMHWVCFHVVLATLFVSILMLLDTINWGEWMGLRAVMSAVMLVPFFWTVLQGFNGQWQATWTYAGLSAACAAIGIGAAPWLARESPLPRWQFGGRTLRQPFSSETRALIWLQWRQIRFVTILLLAPVPLFVAAICLPGLLEARTGREALDVFGRMLPIVDRLLVSLLCIAAGLIGLILPIVEVQWNGEGFRWSQPIERARFQYLRVGFAVGLLALVSVPALLVGVTRLMVFEQISWASFLGRACLVFCAAAAVCTFLLVISTAVVNSRVAVIQPIVGLAGIMLAIFALDQLLDKRGIGLFPVVTVAALVVSVGMLLLPILEQRREL